MDVTPEVVELGVRLTESLARNTATAITDRVRSLKASGKKDEAIAGLEELVSDLINDKAEIARIAQSYQSELVAQRLSSGDVKYITDTVLPLIEQMARGAGQSGQLLMSQIGALRPLLSVETANVLQLLGFDFRKAIGQPLTKLIETLILSRVNQSDELQVESMKREQLLLQLAMDEGAYARFQSLIGRS